MLGEVQRTAHHDTRRGNAAFQGQGRAGQRQVSAVPERHGALLYLNRFHARAEVEKGKIEFCAEK